MVSFFHRRKGTLITCEDSLTAVVFDTLKYLPTEIFWSVLKRSLYHDKLPKVSGELLSISFWDKWNSENTSNSKFVEPDVFLRFNKFDVIIEAKRFDVRQQSINQMKNEIQAYYNEFQEDKKILYFIQLGGLHHKNDELDFSFEDNEVKICKTDWTKLLEQIVIENNRLKEKTSSIEFAFSRILEDTINGFALHRYYKKRWLKDLKTNKLNQTQSLYYLFPYARR